MRLDDFDPNINVGSQDNRGGGFGGFGGGGGGGGMLLGLLPLIGSRFGCAGIAVVLLLMAVFGGLGGIGNLVGGGSPAGQVATRAAPSGEGNATAICNGNPARKSACNAFSSAQKTWTALFAQSGQQFQPPSLQFFDQSGESGCGAAQAAMGPFYCPQDSGVYLDTTFFDELQNRFGASGDFAQDYVIAHEFGHHIQHLLGISAKVNETQRSSSRGEGNAASVRLELQADCYAGVWAARNRDRMEPGDLQEGMTAAQAIGDDTLQKQAGGRVMPESFTHGTSAQRKHWLGVGIQTGDPAQCDTFSGAI